MFLSTVVLLESITPPTEEGKYCLCLIRSLLDDLCTARFGHGEPPFFVCRGHTVRLLSSVLAGRVFVLRRTIAPRVSMSDMHSHFVVATLIFFPKTQRAVGDGLRTV